MHEWKDSKHAIRKKAKHSATASRVGKESTDTFYRVHKHAGYLRTILAPERVIPQLIHIYKKLIPDSILGYYIMSDSNIIHYLISKPVMPITCCVSWLVEI